MEELNKFADKAYNILNNKETQTIYNRSKKIISTLFNKDKECDLNTIIFRLTLIDSYYSTQINSKRLFGIEDLAKEIYRISENKDKIIINKCDLFLNDLNANSEIKSLIESKKYGINKIGKDAGHAVSLISKYLYFLMEYNFPIYDSLAKKSYEKIKSKYQNLKLPEIDKKNCNSYFEGLKKLNSVSRINNFNKLDNLLWLIGKITSGSLSLIIDRINYVNLVEEAEVETKVKNIKTKWKNNKDKLDKINIDEIIRKFIKNNKNLNKIIKDKELIEFINFSFGFNNNNNI